jgi:hypothetical protein
MHRRALIVLAAAGSAVLIGAGPAFAADPWVQVPSVDPVPAGNQLTAVSARTGTDAWAVGSYPGPARHDGRIMLTERWNGTAWSQVPTPNVRFFDEKLLAVNASGANDAWAVGSTNQTSFASTNPIAAHWDGSAWTIVPTPATTGSSKSILDGVVAFSPANTWAVGRSRNAHALIEHWDGSAWSIVPGPDPVVKPGSAFGSATLTGISALSPTDIWAVGSYSTVTGTVVDTFTLTEHYNGTAWTIVPSPNPAPRHPLNGAQQVLNSVAAIGTGDVWAVGQTIDTATGSFFPDKTLTMHWNGVAWAVVASPDGPAEDVLSGVSAASSSDVWAVGQRTDRSGTIPTEASLILHWNGTAWSRTPSPTGAAGDTRLSGVATVPGSAESWAVGTTSGTLILHHAA